MKLMVVGGEKRSVWEGSGGGRQVENVLGFKYFGFELRTYKEEYCRKVANEMKFRVRSDRS